MIAVTAKNAHTIYRGNEPHQIAIMYVDSIKAAVVLKRLERRLPLNVQVIFKRYLQPAKLSGQQRQTPRACYSISASRTTRDPYKAGSGST